MKVGLIQTRGLGDIVIAAPIAMFYINNGHEVFWPIQDSFINSFENAFPEIKFIPINVSKTGFNTAEYFYEMPKRILEDLNCDQIFCLYSHLTGYNFSESKISQGLTFDAYKYAVANVPFEEKWNLHPIRNLNREKELLNLLSLNLDEPYIITQESGTTINVPYKKILNNLDLRVIELKEITDNFFDWLTVIENCQEAFLINSVFANLIDQLNFKFKKTIYLHTESKWTPILKNNWTFL